jgi:hypothetical protein
MNIKSSIFGVLLFGLIFSSCSFYTETTYRRDKNDEYVREDGFILSCRKDGRFLTVGTYTPESWNENFYYGYLHGVKTQKHLKVTLLSLKMMDTNDTLTLHEIQKDREYFFTSNNLDKIVDNNERLKIKLEAKDLETGKREIKELILIRHKHTYSTGTFPHT